MTRRRHRRRAFHTAVLALSVAGVGGGVAACGPGSDDSEAVEAAAEVTRSVDLVFRREAEDRILVVDDGTGEVLRTLEAGEGGFLRGALRPLDRERERFDVPRDAPYTLELRTDGALHLKDPPTGMDLALAAFGPTSRDHFLTLLDGRDPPEHPTLTTPHRPMEDRP